MKNPSVFSTYFDIWTCLVKKLDFPKPLFDAINAVNKNELSCLVEKYSFELTNPEKANAAYVKMHNELENKDDGITELAVYLFAACICHEEFYVPKGISEDIYNDTMACFPRFCGEFYARRGKIGFDCGFWAWRQTSGLLFRVGTLEYEVFSPDDEFSKAHAYFKKGTHYISVHIPSNAVLSRPELDTSYSNGGAFIKKYFPTLNFAGFMCSSWMLAPKLKEFLGENSGIIRFVNDYKITDFETKSDFANAWVFKTESKNYAELPEDTSLQKKLKAVLLAGEQLGTGTGVILF